MSLYVVYVKNKHYSVIKVGDIALLHTTKEIIFTDNVSPICLPSEENSPVAGDICINSGWGTLGNLNVLHQSVLLKCLEYVFLLKIKFTFRL